jgi:hypothetical protein
MSFQFDLGIEIRKMIFRIDRQRNEQRFVPVAIPLPRIDCRSGNRIAASRPY